MATCLEVVGGAVTVIDPQPADVSTCEMVAVSGAEMANNPLTLSVDQGMTIGLAVMAACAVAWGIRRLADVLSTKEDEV